MFTENQTIETPELLPDFIKSGNTPKIGILINPLSGGNLNGLGAIRGVINEYPRVIQRDAQTPKGILEALVDFSRREVDLLAVNARRIAGPIRSWFLDIDQTKPQQPLAVRLFTHKAVD